MAELPEVETIKNDLRQLVRGRRVVGVRVPDETVIQYPDPPGFVAGLAGQELRDIDRRAKYLLIHLASGSFLVVQLILTGQLLLVAPDRPLRKSTRLVFDLDDGQELRLVDGSYLARVHLVTPPELDSQLHLDTLGPEAVAEDLTLEAFAARLRGRRGQVKPLLLDQHVVAGLGNIYVDETLFAAGIHPERKANTLEPPDIARLHAAMRSILAEAIAQRGTTIRNYVDVLGRKGRYQERLQVFGREGKPCPRCGGRVAKTQVGGRQTFYCPHCQEVGIDHPRDSGARALRGD